MDFYSLGIQIPPNRSGDGNIKTFCPKCHNTRHDRHDRSLSVNLSTVLFNCHYCGYKVGIFMAHTTKLHKNKEEAIDPPSLYDISGSAHFYNKADYGIVVHRNRVLKNVLVKVEKVKFRHLGETGKATFSFNPVNGRYLPWELNQTPRWDDTNYLAALRKRQETQSVLFQDFLASPDSRLPGYTGLPD